MSVSIETCAAESFAMRAEEGFEEHASLMRVTAPAPTAGRKTRRGAVLEIWAECGRYILTLNAEQLHWLRVELAKQALAAAPVTP